MQQDNYLNSQNHQAVADETGNRFDPRYLAAKKTIDDRALNQHVWETLLQVLPQTTDHARTNRRSEIGDRPRHLYCYRQ
jgi:hypothetical protein